MTSASSAWSCGLSTNENRLSAMIPTHSQAVSLPASTNSAIDAAPPR